MKAGKRTITQRSPNTTVTMNKKTNVSKSPIPIYEPADNMTENQDMEDSENTAVSKYQEKYKKVEEGEAPRWFKEAFCPLTMDMCHMKQKLDGVDQCKKQCKENTLEIVNLKLDIANLENSNKKLKEQVAQIELENRKKNLIIQGLAETGLNEDTVEQLHDFLRNKLHITADTKISGVYRLGKPPHLKPGTVVKPRNIIAKFDELKDRDRIWEAKSALKGTKLFVSEDLPPQFVEDRRKLLPYLMAACENPKIKKCSFYRDYLIIDGQKFHAGDIGALPAELLGNRVHKRHLHKMKGTAFLDKQAFSAIF